MFTKNNRQLQSTAKAEINNDNQNNRKASVFINKLFASGRAFLFVAAFAFSFMAASASSAQAQQNNYWATDGCYYSHNGTHWSRLCYADQNRTKYFFDAAVNDQWQRFFYLDTIVYSDSGLTFTTGYNYSTKTWTRTYSNGSIVAFSEARPEWILVGNNRQNGNLNNAAQEARRITDKMQRDANQRAVDLWNAPACRSSYNGCR